MSRTMELLDRAWVLLKAANEGCLAMGEWPRHRNLWRAMCLVGRAEGLEANRQCPWDETARARPVAPAGWWQWVARAQSEVPSAIRGAMDLLGEAEKLAVEAGNHDQAMVLREARGFAAAAAGPGEDREAPQAEPRRCGRPSDPPPSAQGSDSGPPCVPPGSGATRGSRLQCPCCGAWVETEVRLVAGQE